MAIGLLSSFAAFKPSTAEREPMPVYNPEDYPTDGYTDRELLELAFHNANEARFMINAVLKAASSSPLLSQMLPKVD